MKVLVKLFGPLRQLVSDYPEEGIELEARPGEAGADVLARLGITRSQRAVLVVDGLIAKQTDPLRDGASLNVFLPLDGG